MLARIQQYISDGETIIPDWHKFIDNKKVPIADRWEVFLAAPASWKKDTTDGSIPINCLSDMFQSCYDDLHMDRGQEMDAEELIEAVEAKIGEDGFEDLDDALINKAKAELIKMRMGSWTQDW